MILGCDPMETLWHPGMGAYAMGGPPRTKVPSRQVAVSGRAVFFCTGLACVFHGLLQAPTRQDADAAATARWNGDIERFLADVRDAHLQDAAAERALAAWPGPVIGWTPLHPTDADAWLSVVCTDLAWTIAVLGRVEGKLLLPQRRPRLSWDRLFGQPFALDDARLAAVAAVPRDLIAPITTAGAKP